MSVVEYRGKRIKIPDDMTDEELEEWVAVLDTEIDAKNRAERVEVAAGQLFQDARLQDDDLGGVGEYINDARNWAADLPYVGHVSENIFGSETRPSPVLAGANEFMRNFSIDAFANVAGARTPEYGGTNDYQEQRDAHRLATDMFTDASGLPGWIDDGLSLWGALSSPGLKGGGAAVRRIHGGGRGATAGRVATAGGAGALEGALAGALESEGEDFSKMFEEALLYGLIGGSLGSGVQAGSEAVGKGFRGAYADEHSADRYAIQEAAGYQPTGGSVGNENIAMLENTLRDAPASWARIFPDSIIPDVKSKQTSGNEQIDALFAQAAHEISPDKPLTKTSDFNPAAQGAVDNMDASIRGEIRDTGEELVDAVGAGTPVKIRNIEEVPRKLYSEDYRGDGMPKRAQKDVNRLAKDRARGGPVNTEKSRVLGARFNTLEKQRKNLTKKITQYEESIQRLRAQGNVRRADALQRRLKAPDGLRKQLGDVNEEIKRVRRRSLDEMGVPFRSVMDWRSGIGRQGDKAKGLRSYEKGVLYGPTTRAMEGASEEFKPLNDKLRLAYKDDAVLGKWFGSEKTNYATQFPKFFTDGRMDAIDLMKRRMDPQDYAQLRGSVVHQMGLRSNKGTQEWSDVVFSNNWSKLGEDAKLELAGSKEAKVLMDSLAKVTGSLKNLRNETNVSRSGVSGGILASLAVQSMTAAKFFGRLGVADAAVASDAMAKALAGRPNKLNELLRNAIIASETRDPQHRAEGAETYQPFRIEATNPGNQP